MYLLNIVIRFSFHISALKISPYLKQFFLLLFNFWIIPYLIPKYSVISWVKWNILNLVINLENNFKLSLEMSVNGGERWNFTRLTSLEIPREEPPTDRTCAHIENKNLLFMKFFWSSCFLFFAAGKLEQAGQFTWR